MLAIELVIGKTQKAGLRLREGGGGLVALQRRSTSRRTAGQVAEETARQPSSKPSYSRGIPFVGDQFRLLATRTFSYMKSQ